MIFRLTIFLILTCISNHISAQFNTITLKYHLRVIESAQPSIDSLQQSYSDFDLEEETEYADPKTQEAEDSIQRLTKENRVLIHLPLSGKIHITSPYGYRIHPITKKRKFHRGVDLRAKNIPVYSMMDGIIERIGEDPKAGRYIRIRHGQITVSYLHLSVTLGQEYIGKKVDAGEIVAISGNSGSYSTGSHLHVETRINNISINPEILFNEIKKIQ